MREPLEVKLATSPTLGGYLVIAHLLALFSCIWLSQSVSVSIMSALILTGSLVGYCYILLGGGRIKSFRMDQDRIVIASAQGLSSEGVLLQRHFVCGKFIIITLRLMHQRRSRPMLVMADAVEFDLYRKLKVRLRFLLD